MAVWVSPLCRRESSVPLIYVMLIYAHSGWSFLIDRPLTRAAFVLDHRRARITFIVVHDEFKSKICRPTPANETIILVFPPRTVVRRLIVQLQRRQRGLNCDILVISTRVSLDNNYIVQWFEERSWGKEWRLLFISFYFQHEQFLCTPFLNGASLIIRWNLI